MRQQNAPIVVENHFLQQLSLMAPIIMIPAGETGLGCHAMRQQNAPIVVIYQCQETLFATIIIGGTNYYVWWS